MWEYRGQKRPEFAETPGPGQESVWDYPRPPIVETRPCDIEVRAGATVLAKADRCHRVLETASPPSVYIPKDAVEFSKLTEIPSASMCEWKGRARYWALTDDPAGIPVAWAYDHPSERFAAIAGTVSFYPGRVACWLDGERVRPQPSEFYGGWMTDAIVGPVKGEPGTGHW